MNTILFDLDGTLLPMDMKLFESLYFQTLGHHFSDLIEPKELASKVWASTKFMVENTEYKTNEEKFMGDFALRVKDNFPIFKDRFDSYYDESFTKVKESVKDNEYIKKSIEVLKSKGYEIVVATNPLFPAKAIYKRINWAGFKVEDFKYISTFENNHYCKPQIKYYEEILRDINKDAEECLMVGNDVQEDLVAGKLGMQTYLITDNILHRTEDEIFCDYKGDYQDFYNFALSLPEAK